MFMKDVSALVRHMRTYIEREMASTGLGFPEQLILMVLSSREQVNQSQIAEFLDIDRAAVAKSAAKLEQKGLIAREVDQDNKRAKIITLTPAAHHLINDMKQVFSRWEEDAFKGITAEERAIFESVIARVALSSANLLSGKDDQ